MRYEVTRDPMYQNPPTVTVHVDEEDTWSADVTIARMAAPLLKQFRDNAKSYPCDAASDNVKSYPNDQDDMTLKKWKDILSEIIWGLELVADDSECVLSSEEKDRLQKSMELFGKYFTHLWD